MVDSEPQTLPIEIEEHILDWLRFDRRALDQCSVVCNRWSLRARRHLFYSVCIEHRRDLAPFCDLLDSKLDIRSYIHRVTVMTARSENHAETLFELASVVLLPKLPYLRCWRFRDTGSFDTALSCSRHLLATSRQWASVAQLILHDILFRTERELLRLVCSLPGLLDLRCYAIRVGTTDALGSLERPMSNTGITKLEMSDMCNHQAIRTLAYLASWSLSLADFTFSTTGIMEQDVLQAIRFGIGNLQYLKIHLAHTYGVGALSLSLHIVRRVVENVDFKNLQKITMQIPIHSTQAKLSEDFQHTEAYYQARELDEVLSRLRNTEVWFEFMSCDRDSWKYWAHRVADLFPMLNSQRRNYVMCSAQGYEVDDDDLPTGHGCHRRVSALAVSPDGRWAATGAQTTILWDLQAGRIVDELSWRYELEEDPRIALVFSPNGRLLAWSADVSSTVTLMNVPRCDTYRQLATYPHNMSIQALAWSVDGAYITACSATGVICLWSEDSLQVDNSLLGVTPICTLYSQNIDPGLAPEYPHGPPRRRIVFSPDADWLSAGTFSSFHAWDIRSLRSEDPDVMRPLLSDATVAADAFAFDGEGRRLVTGHPGGRARVLDMETLETIASLERPEDDFSAAAFSPDGARVLLVDKSNRTVTVWSWKEMGPGAVRRITFAAGVGSGGVFCLSPTGEHVAYDDGEGVVHVGAVCDGSEIAMFTLARDRSTAVTLMQFTLDGRTLIYGMEDGIVEIQRLNV